MTDRAREAAAAYWRTWADASLSSAMVAEALAGDHDDNPDSLVCHFQRVIAEEQERGFDAAVTELRQWSDGFGIAKDLEGRKTHALAAIRSQDHG